METMIGALVSMLVISVAVSLLVSIALARSSATSERPIHPADRPGARSWTREGQVRRVS